ncbi:hypothetical protein BLOT_009780 [Blomia tropicalis]|nr:hypothetical protein BLOT_009780 [Blomia tropicalis]
MYETLIDMPILLLLVFGSPLDPIEPIVLSIGLLQIVKEEKEKFEFGIYMFALPGSVDPGNVEVECPTNGSLVPNVMHLKGRQAILLILFDYSPMSCVTVNPYFIIM